MKRFTKGCLMTALVLFILGCLICAVCGLLGGFRQVMSGALNGIAGIPFGYYRHTDGGYSFGFLDDDWDDDWEEEDSFWEKENWQKTEVNGTKQKLPVTGDSLSQLLLEVTDCSLKIEESSDDAVWLSVSEDRQDTYYNIEKDFADKDILYIRKNEHHRTKNWNDKFHDEITLYMPPNCAPDMINIMFGAGHMETVTLKADSMEINIGAGVCEARGFEAEKINLLVGAGQIETAGLKADTAVLEIGAGEMIVQGMEVRELMEVEVGMGNVNIAGKATGKLDAECNLGNLNMNLAGSEDDYGFEVDCSMADVRIGSHHYSAFSDSASWNSDRKNQMEIDCEMGNIAITFTN